MLATCLTHSGWGVVLRWSKFSNPAPAGFEFTNPARSGSGRIWKSEIRYIPRNMSQCSTYTCSLVVLVYVISVLYRWTWWCIKLSQIRCSPWSL